MFGPSGQNVQQHAAKEQEQKQDLVIALEVNNRDPQTRKKHFVFSKLSSIIKSFQESNKKPAIHFKECGNKSYINMFFELFLNKKQKSY